MTRRVTTQVGRFGNASDTWAQFPAKQTLVTLLSKGLEEFNYMLVHSLHSNLLDWYHPPSKKKTEQGTLTVPPPQKKTKNTWIIQYINKNNLKQLYLSRPLLPFATRYPSPPMLPAGLDREWETFFRRGLPVLDRERDLNRASYCLDPTTASNDATACVCSFHCKTGHHKKKQKYLGILLKWDTVSQM